MIRAPLPRKVVFDTSVYIQAIQSGPTTLAYPLLISALPRTYLSAVVVQELYSGAIDATGERLVETFVLRSEKTGRMLSPTYEGWKQTGKVLARIGRREPAQRSRLPKLVRDLLLALSAKQVGATLYTFNRADFTLISRYTQFALQVL